jgi:hypothetical protein
VDEVLVVLDRALRTEFSTPAELGRLADVFGKLREERSEWVEAVGCRPRPSGPTSV